MAAGAMDLGNTGSVPWPSLRQVVRLQDLVQEVAIPTNDFVHSFNDRGTTSVEDAILALKQTRTYLETHHGGV